MKFEILTAVKILRKSSGLKKEAVYSSETFVSTYKSAQRCNPEE
jgi:hypothetical protein